MLEVRPRLHVIVDAERHAAWVLGREVAHEWIVGIHDQRGALGEPGIIARQRSATISSSP